MTNNTKPKPNAETLSLKLLIEELSPSDDYYINLLRGLILSFFMSLFSVTALQ